MFYIKLESRVVNNMSVEIKEESKDKFKEILKTYIGPNSGWYADGNCLPLYIDRFFDDFVESCKRHV